MTDSTIRAKNNPATTFALCPLTTRNAGKAIDVHGLSGKPIESQRDASFATAFDFHNGPSYAHRSPYANAISGGSRSERIIVCNPATLSAHTPCIYTKIRIFLTGSGVAAHLRARNWHISNHAVGFD